MAIYKSHAELEKFHYEAVRDSLEYRMVGLMEIMQEELLMEMPRVSIEEIELPVKEKEKERSKERERVTYSLQREQRGMLQQIHGEVFYLKNRLDEHLARSKKKVYTIE